jgi:hypothetical protein
MEGSRLLYRNRLMIIYNCSDRQSEASMRYLNWFYNTICRLPVDCIDSQDIIVKSESLPLISGNTANYIMIFVLSSVCSGKEDPRLWERIFLANGRIPIVAFYQTAYASRGNQFAEEMFNVVPSCERSGYIRETTFTEESIGEGVVSSYSKDSRAGRNIPGDMDRFVVVKSLRSEDFIPLALNSGDVVASQSGLNLFIGQKGVAVPREDGFLEYNRPTYFIGLLSNLLKKSSAGYVRLKLAKLPVALRMDDPPATWEQLTEKRRILQANEYDRIMTTLSKHGGKMTCFVTPATVSKDGRPKSWIETEHSAIKAILDVLRNEERSGVLEIGAHGLTHLTIGHRPPSTMARLLCKIRLGKHNLSREFYDSELRKEIPYKLQKKQIENSLSLIVELFGSKLKCFAPPAHVWDDSTEKILHEVGISYLSADMNFYLYSEGCNFRKNPAPIGQSTYPKGNLLYVSATVFGRYGTFKQTLKLFHEMGIPLVWQQHNFYPSWFTSEILERFFEDLESFQEKTFVTIGELGDLLQEYSRIKASATLQNGFIKCEVDTDIPIIVEAFYRGRKETREIAAGHNSIQLDLS